MTTRSGLAPAAAVGIWAATLIGSWTMATAILGSINDAVIGCAQDAAPPAAGSGRVAGWLILAVAALVPVLVMVAVSPADQRGRLIGLAGVIAAVWFVAASIWIGPCL